MLKMRKIAFILIALPLLTACGNNVDETALGLNETYEGEPFNVEITDFYVGDFVMNEDLNLSFDQYVVADVEMTNTTDEEQNAQTLFNFEIEDDFDRHGVVIDENDKKFAQALQPGETFEIPLVFAVDEADTYNLYYSKSLKEEDKDTQVWTLDGSNLETKKVEYQQKHNKLGSTEEVER